MLKLKRIAVTGGLACGKSTVCAIFRDLGAYVVSADTITHQLLLSDTALIQKVCSLLGQDILEEGAINRNKVAKCVFESPKLLKQLEKVVHPAVQQELEKAYLEACRQKTWTLFVAEVPLLFEAKMDAWFDGVIAVAANEEACVQRFCLQNDCGPAGYYARMQHQMPPDAKEKRAAYIINNKGTLQALRSEVSALYQQITGVSG
jgi:dephospho-CoA kinase